MTAVKKLDMHFTSSSVVTDTNHSIRTGVYWHQAHTRAETHRAKRAVRTDTGPRRHRGLTAVLCMVDLVQYGTQVQA